MATEQQTNLTRPDDITTFYQTRALDLVRSYGLLSTAHDSDRIKAGIVISMRAALALDDELLPKTPKTLQESIQNYVNNLESNIRPTTPAYDGRPESYNPTTQPVLTKDRPIYCSTGGVVYWDLTGKMFMMPLYPHRSGSNLEFDSPHVYTEVQDEPQKQYHMVRRDCAKEELDQLKQELLQTKIMTQEEIDLFFQ